MKKQGLLSSFAELYREWDNQETLREARRALEAKINRLSGERTCPGCGKKFSVSREKVISILARGRWVSRFCRKCRAKRLIEKGEWKCRVCGKPFTPKKGTWQKVCPSCWAQQQRVLLRDLLKK